MSASSRIARRYAKGLFGIDRGDLERAKKRRDMLAPIDELFNNRDAGRFLRNPVMPDSLKKDLLSYALTEGQADDAVASLVKTMVEEGRVHVIPDFIVAYKQLIDDAEGVAQADVVSALPLPPDDIKAIGDRLGQLLDKRVEVRPSVNPSLLGGFIARVGNYRIDMSLRTKLDGLSQTAAQDSLR